MPRELPVTKTTLSEKSERILHYCNLFFSKRRLTISEIGSPDQKHVDEDGGNIPGE